MKNNRLHKYITIISFSLLLMACAVGRPKNPNDPLETINRKTFAFNQQIDRFIFRPVAKTYDFIVPNIIQHRVTNFFNNLDEVGNISNDILQANLKWALRDTTRFFINTTVGVLGLFDPASHIGLERNSQDFGLTLAKWGVEDSPYFVIPFLGPSTLRDTIGSGYDYSLSITNFIKPDSAKYGLLVLQTIDARAQLLSTDKVLRQAFDPYAFMYDAYSQKRKMLYKRVKK